MKVFVTRTEKITLAVEIKEAVHSTKELKEVAISQAKSQFANPDRGWYDRDIPYDLYIGDGETYKITAIV